jgi:hypothetical protein
LKSLKKPVDIFQRAFIFGLLLLFSMGLKGAGKRTPIFEWSKELQQAHSLIYKLQLENATESIAAADGQNLAVVYLQGHIHFANGLTQNQSELALQALDDALLTIRKGNKEAPWVRLALGELGLFKAILLGRTGSHTAAALQAFQSYKQIQSIYRSDPDFQYAWGMRAVFELALASLPDKYGKLANLVGFNGDLETGIGLLEAFHRFSLEPEQKWQREKAGLLWVYATHQLGLEKGITFQHAQVPLQGNLLATYLQSQLYFEDGRGDLALKSLQACDCEGQFPKFPFLYFQRGRAQLTQLNATALVDFQRFLATQTAGGNFLHAAYRFQAWGALVFESDGKKSRDLFAHHWQAALALPAPQTGTDKQAMRDLQTPVTKSLLRARLLFDGGQWQLALDELNRMTPAQRESQHNSYWYRRGRVLQKLQESKLALAAFENMKPEQGDFEYANGLLQQGFLLEKMGKKEAAAAAYRKALAQKDYSNMDGVQQKAKSGLRRLED